MPDKQAPAVQDPDDAAAAAATESLARVLTRIAALQGHAVPWHRFALMSQSANGVDLKDVPLLERAVELWNARFPAGTAQLATLPLAPSETPALWLPPETVGPAGTPSLVPGGPLVVCGSLASGALSCLDDRGETTTLSPQRAAEGRLLVLRCEDAIEARRQGGPVSDGLEAEASAASGVRRRTATEWFRHAIFKRWRVFVEGTIATLTVNVIALTASFYTMQVYDRVVPTQGYSTLWVLTVGVLIAIVLELAMRQVRNRLIERACKHIDEELSAVFFGHALAIRMDQRPRTIGTFAAQIRHFEMVRNFMTSSTLFALADAPFALLFVAVIALIAGPVALVPLAFIPVSILTGLFFGARLKRLTEMHMRESNFKNGLLIEAIDGIESLKACGAEWKMLERWRALTRTLADDEVAIKDITNLSTNLAQSLQQLSYIGLVAAGVFAIGAGDLTVGGLIACTIISGRALGPIAQSSGLIVQWQQARMALRGLDNIMALPPDASPEERRLVPDHCQGRLRIQGLRFNYSKDVAALNVDELCIRPGERVAVLGAVGSGKTTLIKLLSGLYQPAEGRVFLDDNDLAHLAPEFAREQIGYLTQDVRLFQGTLRENVALGLPSPSDEQILQAARVTGLDRVIAAHPHGLGLEISEGGRGLSGGQRQLVGLTRMLLARPRILLLDEPTASMDPQLEEQVAERIFGTRPADTTLVVVTHKPALLRYFTRVVILDRGRIAADGPRDEILRRLRESAQAQIQANERAAAPLSPTTTAA
ncbi:MAG: type I secretion system permease/ATPase [Thauera sp.]|nr:type I secretion system permease/ATPase [Thauera sp.]